jgi:hypothetical protein
VSGAGSFRFEFWAPGCRRGRSPRSRSTAPTFFSYFGEPGRFGCTRKAQGFVGFYPATEDSGQSERKGTALSKEGPGLLRRDLFRASDHFLRVDPDGARVYYDQMVNKGKHHTSALFEQGASDSDKGSASDDRLPKPGPSVERRWEC